MQTEKVFIKRGLTWALLFVGFCCVFGWVGTSFILLTRFTNSRHFETLGATLRTILMDLTFTSFYVVIGVAVFAWGIHRFRHTQQKKGLIPKSLIPAAILTPFLAIGGIALILLAPFVFAHARAIVAGPNIVQSAASPDGTSKAFVIDKPSIDGPNHHLYVKDAAGTQTFVTNLPEDVDFNEKIIWSPHNDIVVFRSHFKLIAYSLASNQTQEVKLGGDYHWRTNGTFWVDYKDVLRPTDIQFPQAGMLTYRLNANDSLLTISFSTANS